MGIPAAQIENYPRRATQAFTVDPLRDPRWSELVDRHPSANIFHTAGWLEALHRTYKYEPLVVTTSPPDEPLSNGIVLCKVRSWATGTRLVSLPFSDHCEPLVNGHGELQVMVAYLKGQVERGECRFVELRTLRDWHAGMLDGMELETDDSFCIHQLDLTPSLNELYHAFHNSCVQRKIRRAEREGLVYEDGRSEVLLSKFYELLLRTRRRHQLPPQSMQWFRNLAACLGDRLTVRLVSKDGHPIASIMTAGFRDTTVYKYGCSDAHYHNLGGICLLMWNAIQDAKTSGAKCFDLGRTEQANEGLVTFKERWGSKKGLLSYYRYPAGVRRIIHSDWKLRLIQRTCRYLPDPLFERLGALLYKHVG